MRASSLLAATFVLAGTALGQTPAEGPAPSPTPIPCWGMAGLEIGMDRITAFQRMARLERDKAEPTHDLKVLHTPRGRPWTVEVTFDGTDDKARITLLHYSLAPPQDLVKALLERYGRTAVSPVDPTSTYWNDTRCGLTIRYKPILSEAGQPIQEEVWVEPLAAKGAKKPH